MKKYPQGLVPTNFQFTGKILLGIGTITLILKIFNIFQLADSILIIAIIFIIAGLWLMFIIPKD